ncbi:MAG TPA: single-stranded-DNA-specific exonuclease RecJ [Candidatus Deferrimicrobium sp.]|nr:single-stranded-DNA-specific exonuclease RecJ [Candidatus Deferrimicrobium sp.]
MELNNPIKLGELAEKILNQRGYTNEAAIRAFLYPEFYQPTEPLELPGMRETVELLLQAVQSGEKICVYGDYDADGITSTTVLVSMLRSIGAKVGYHIPDRFSEGYGMNEGVVRHLAQAGCNLILTCDCGISNLAEIQLARDLGMKVLITDHHHLPPELPNANGIVNPQLLPEGHKAKYLPGVGVAYMLSKACLLNLGKGRAEEYLDVVALGIVADVVPLLNENRYLLQLGLERLRRTDRLGLQALLEVCKLNPLEISEEDIGFQLVPRLNASGRIASAALAVELLLCEDSANALKMAGELDEINQRRRILGEAMYLEAQAMLGEESTPGPLVLYQPHWHHGVVGIIAGRLAELYKVPVLLMSLKEDGVTITGSARSIAGVHIYEVLQKCASFLHKFGGHAGAAGFSLHREQLELFSKAVRRELEQAMTLITTETCQSYDLEIGLEELNMEVYRELLPLGPFGEGNPTPLLCSREVQVLSQKPTAEEKHLRLILGQANTSHQAMWWWGGSKQPAENVQAVYSLSINKWQGKENLQLIIADLSEDKPDYHVREIEPPLLEIIDYRQSQELGLALPTFELGQLFGENLRSVVEGIKDRYSITECEILVLLSIPPSLRALQEMLVLSRAQKLVLCYGAKEGAQDKEFLQQLLSWVKYAVTKRNGRLELPALASTTGQMEISVAAGLNFLQAKGLIAFEFDGPERVYLSQGDGSAKQGLPEYETKLRSLLAETRAFRRYLLTASPESILQIIGPMNPKNKED